MQLEIEHNLSKMELSDTLIALAKSHNLEYEIHDCLSKAVGFEPKDPADPLLAELVNRFRDEYEAAVHWICAFIDKVVSGEGAKPSFSFFKAKGEGIAEDRPLSREEIESIQNAIRTRFDFIVKGLDSDFIPDDKLLKEWKEMGIIGPNVTAADFALTTGAKLIRNAFLFGRIHMAVERGARGYAKILQIALEAPLTRPDRYAIEAAERSAAAYVTKFSEDVVGTAGKLIDDKNRQIVHDMIVSQQKRELTAIKMREGAPDRLVTNWRQLSGEFYRTMEDKARDWDRIAFTETRNAELDGKAMEMLHKYGPDQLVYKLPLPTACPQCNFLYKDANGVPRLFKLSTMLGYGTNVGRKPLPVRGGVVSASERSDGAEEWKPVVGTMHPWCECRLYSVNGYEAWIDEAKKPKD